MNTMLVAVGFDPSPDPDPKIALSKSKHKRYRKIVFAGK